MNNFQKEHLVDFLDLWKGPLDHALNLFFRDHTSLGSTDRGKIAESLYKLIRWQILIDHLIGAPVNWEKRVDFLDNFNLQEHLDNSDLPEQIRASFPPYLYDRMKQHYGDKAFELALHSNEPAPTFIRYNPLKTNREELAFLLKDLRPTPTTHSPYGLTLGLKANVFSLKCFNQGFFEMQDESSQQAADLMNPKPGQKVLDYCAGSGGKTLAFAHKMEGKGQIYLHDIRKNILIEAKKRLKRAGIQNAQVIHSLEDGKLKKLKKQFDWVLVDAPCSGSGTLRRNPDMKDKITEGYVSSLQSEQRVIFEKALSYLKPGGFIVYATCSFLNEENEIQIEHFLKTYGLESINTFKSLPQPGFGDGLFACVMKKSFPGMIVS